MIKNYIKVALRSLSRHKGYTAINILGLAIGIACVILIMLYVQKEVSYDNFHANGDQIYRLNIQVANPQSGAITERAIGPYRLADELKTDFSDFEHIIRFAPRGGEAIEYNDQVYVEEHLAFVDPDVFNTFDFHLLKGDANTALEAPFSLVITKKVSKKYFGEADGVGKVVSIRGQDFVVTGIMEEIPKNSRFDFDILVSMNSGKQVFSRIVLENWGEGYVETYAMLPLSMKPSDLTERLQAFIDVKLESWKHFSPVLLMQPLSDIYLHSQDISSFTSGSDGDITYVYAFSFIALFILIIACINFMNLSTAKSSMRAREVGLRKVVGAMRGQLIGQFLSESTILAFISLIIGLLLARFSLPFFNDLAESSLSLNLTENIPLFAGLIVVTLFVGIAAGSYPALLLSSFKPINVLSGNLSTGSRGGTIRKVLVAFQFATSIFLLVITGIVYQQLNYCNNMDLGFDKENVLIMGMPQETRTKYAQFTSELLQNPSVIAGGGSSRVPPGTLSSSLQARPQGIPEDQQKGMQTVWTDFGFIETMGFEMAAGRSFSRDFPSDEKGAFILNEAAVKDIGWTNETAIGKTFGSSEIADWDAGQWENRDGQVIGVIKDFHFETLKREIVPTVYFVAPLMAWNYAVRLNGSNVSEAIAHIEKVYTDFNPDTPFDYTFVDENYAELYQVEERQGKIFGVFALLAIFVACLGLAGLASFTAEQKRKEVGIRKILGASSTNIIFLLSKEFTWLVIIAAIIASPLAWYIMNNWLQDFAYRIPIGISIFILSGGIAMLIAWLTVSFQTARAALDNPINSLRHE
ncbi:MAG: ABC transporter permease [Saprospiraceae bacterium]